MKEGQVCSQQLRDGDVANFASGLFFTGWTWTGSSMCQSHDQGVSRPSILDIACQPVDVQVGQYIHW